MNQFFLHKQSDSLSIVMRALYSNDDNKQKNESTQSNTVIQKKQFAEKIFRSERFIPWNLSLIKLSQSEDLEMNFQEAKQMEDAGPGQKFFESQSDQSSQKRRRQQRRTQERIQPKKKSKASRGRLQQLTDHLFNVAKQLEPASQALIVQTLIDEIKEQSGRLPYHEENNIKRRVYDSINVLIAIGMLVKDGNILTTQGQSRKRNLLTAQQREQNLKDAAQKLAEKKKQLEELKKKKEKLDQLIALNQKANRRNKKKQIALPFVCFVVPADSNKIFDRAEGKFTLEVGCRQGYEFAGDMDFLMTKVNDPEQQPEQN